MIGPIASVLVNKYGCKLVTVLGTIFASAGFLISIFAPTIWFMYFSFGVLAGNLFSVIMLSHYGLAQHGLLNTRDQKLWGGGG